MAAIMSLRYGTPLTLSFPLRKSQREFRAPFRGFRILSTASIHSNA